MIIRNLVRPRNQTPPPPPPVMAPPGQVFPEFVSSYGSTTASGKRVTPETSKTISTAYRCGNIISDDIASMPLQMFRRVGRNIEQIAPDARLRNMAYLLEVQPNRWMAPIIFKKTVILWLLYWGDAYIWQPLQSYRELFILAADRTFPLFDTDGNLWYQTIFPNGSTEIIPEIEIAHLMINSTNGIKGKSVIEYAKETMGRQIGSHETQNRLHGNGLNPAAVMWINGEVNKQARKKLKTEYTEEISGSENSGGVAIFDNKIAKFEPVTMKASDAQFLESINATDVEIANFFGLPLYKLNYGKQSYESNSQQDLDYLKTTLNPYLVQWEQVARLKWLSQADQEISYFRFIREALLQTDAKTRAEYLEKKILSGQLSPNEARRIDDMSAFPGGDSRYIPANMAVIAPDGTLQTGGSNAQQQP